MGAQVSQVSPQFPIPATWRAVANVCSSSAACSGPKENMEDVRHIAIISLSINLRKVRGSHLAEVMRKSQHKMVR